MLDPKRAAETDQAVAMLAETLPPLLGRFFHAMEAEGLSRAEALELTKMLLYSLMTSTGPRTGDGS